MKNIFFILFMISVSISAWSQSDNKESIVFDTTVYDFGVLSKGANAECVFSYTNKGKSPVIITNVKASCGCTVPTWTKEPVKSGNSGTVKVKYNTKTVGVFSKTITVNTNDNNRTITLTIKGEVKKNNK